MESNKKIAKNTLLIYLRLAVATISGLFYSRFFFRALGAEDFGIYNVVGSVVSMMVFINTIMVSTTYRFIAYEMGKKEGNVNKVFNVSLIIHIVLAFLVLLIAATLGVWYLQNVLNVDSNRMPDVMFVFGASMCSCIISIICVPYLGIVTATENFGTIAKIQILNSLLTLLASVLLSCYEGGRLRLYAVLVASLSILISFQYVYFCLRKYKKYVNFNNYKDKQLFRQMLGFTGWTAIGAAAWISQRQGASVVLNYFFNTIVNAAFGVSLTIYNLVSSFSKAIAQSAAPQITKSYSSRNYSRSVDLASYISKYVVFLMLLFSVPILLETDFLIGLWLGNDVIPEYTVMMCKLSIVCLIIDGAGEGLNTLVQATGKIKWFQIILSSMQILSLFASYILFNSGYSPLSIFYCFICVSIVNIVIRQFLMIKIIDFNVKRLLEISYFRIIYVIIAITPMFFIVPKFPDGWTRLIIVLPLSVFLTLCSIWLFGINKKEKKYVLSIVKNKIKRR